MELPSLEVTTAVLKGHYTPPKPENPVMDSGALSDLLEQIAKESKDESLEPLLNQILKHQANTSLSKEHYACISFIDEGLTKLLNQTDLDYRIEVFVRKLSPFIALIAIKDDVQAIMKQQPILSLIELISIECLGWNEDLGILGEEFIEQLEAILQSFLSGKDALEDCEGKLRTFFDKEKLNRKRREEQLAASQTKLLASEKGRYHAAESLNKLMKDKSLPLFIIFMLQGTWFGFIQEVLNHYGMESEQWKRIMLLTKSIISVLQPNIDKEKQLKAIEGIPAQVNGFTKSLDFEHISVEQCLEDVVAEFDAIKKDEASPACDFDLLVLDDSGLPLSPEMREYIANLDSGEWFIYDDKESEEKVARIKLVLNWSESQKLLFTNLNHRKVLRMDYGEFGAFLADKTIKPLNAKLTCFELFQSCLLDITQQVRRQKDKIKQTVEVAKIKSLKTDYLADRKSAMETALAKQKQLAKIKYQRALILRDKAKKRILLAQEAVSKLNVDAWVKLPLMEGVQTPCRLAAIISATSTYIFTNRGGIKVAEHSAAQLSQMIVTENSEILDTGADFENILANVITGLREDKNKSFDELSGNTT